MCGFNDFVRYGYLIGNYSKIVCVCVVFEFCWYIDNDYCFIFCQFECN